ncbi:unnamed protein product [Blepharisma stoltei]|uniref:DOMON domain-containing protein n=1 Tax=Blepharisma stoltei TaxID=1481888 RepID=A0AAU9IAJ4_9CILI|nr:unnamed protein product [Blepharisma stoltei]
MKLNLVFLGLIIFVNAGIEYLPRGMKWKWYFPTPDVVNFELWIPHETHQGFDWQGIAIQDVRDPRDNFKCDYFIAFYKEGGFTDRYSEANGLPPLDEVYGGTQDITSEKFDIDGYTVFTLNRKLLTGDIYDVPFDYGRPYLLKWSIGNFNEKGEIQRHTMDNMGMEYFVLTEQYHDRNHDERGKYGPWVEYPPEDENLPDVRNPQYKEWSLMVEDMFPIPPESSTGAFASDKDNEFEPKREKRSSSTGAGLSGFFKN